MRDSDNVLGRASTEARRPGGADLDVLSTEEIIAQMNEEDTLVPVRISRVVPIIAKAVDEITNQMRQGGRLIYSGAGSAGRIGVLDAAEMLPTFNVPTERVWALLAGRGRGAANGESAEDDAESGRGDVARLNLTSTDCLIGIAASGRTPYTLATLEAANERGALTVALVCNTRTPMAAIADIAIEVVVGPEMISGSTRLKAGTAQKLVLNQISTAVMVRLGKTYGDLMIDVRPVNEKLTWRCCRIVAAACSCTESEARRLLTLTGGDVRAAIVVGLTGVDEQVAGEIAAGYPVLREAIDVARAKVSSTVPAGEPRVRTAAD